MNELPIKKIIILGGGTAGWMTAIKMANGWKRHRIKIELLESPDIGAIGVGEGSTPVMKHFFDTLQIAEEEWMPQCDATFKNGITFKGWSTELGFEQYFHPFPSGVDDKTIAAFEFNTLLRRKGFNVEAHPNRFFLMSKLAEEHKSPIPHENFPFEQEYGYHFDSIKLGNFLRNKAIEKGVVHTETLVNEVLLDENGNINCLVSKTGERYSAELFIDCSGFASVLLGKTLKVRYKSFKENLFNDSAVAIPTPVKEYLPTETISTALSYGWAWRIPLTNRFGNGYVYSSDYCSTDQAETELRSHLGLLDSDVQARHLKMKVGRYEKHWHKNCVAIGLSQGFIEPLEATAIQFILNTIQEFITAIELGDFSNKNQMAFNNNINHAFEHIRDYVVLHYKLNSRTDTEYWKDCRDDTPITESLQKILTCWASNADMESELRNQKIDQYFRAISWNHILAGMDAFPLSQEKLRVLPKELERYNLQQIDEFIRRCSLNFDIQKTLT